MARYKQGLDPVRRALVLAELTDAQRAADEAEAAYAAAVEHRNNLMYDAAMNISQSRIARAIGMAVSSVSRIVVRMDNGRRTGPNPNQKA